MTKYQRITITLSHRTHVILISIKQQTLIRLMAFTWKNHESACCLYSSMAKNTSYALYNGGIRFITNTTKLYFSEADLLAYHQSLKCACYCPHLNSTNLHRIDSESMSDWIYSAATFFNYFWIILGCHW